MAHLEGRGQLKVCSSLFRATIERARESERENNQEEEEKQFKRKIEKRRGQKTSRQTTVVS